MTNTVGNWSVGTNWSPSGVPGLADTVTIGSGTVTVDANVNVTSITISGGTVAVSGASTTITTSGDFTLSGGTFTSGTAATNTISVGGNLAVSNTDSSLKGYWKLDETSTGTAADSSGSGFTLTHTAASGGGPTPSASVPTVGFPDTRSLQFVTANRDAALVAMPAGLQLSLPVTISAWYRATNMGTNAGEIASGTDSYVLRLSRATNGVDLVKKTGTNTWVTLSSSPANYLDGNWHQVVGVLSTSGMTIYFDGASVASNANSTAIDYSSINNFAIGRNGGANTLCDFDGNLDDVRVYNRALSAGEISTLAAGSVAGTFTLSSPLSVSDVTISSTGTLTLSGANSIVTLAKNKTLTMNGTLNSSSSASTGPTITVASSVFGFHIGSVDGATPTLNISKLAVSGTDNDGMRINGSGASNTTATTTFKRFDNLSFTNGKATGSAAFLQIYATSLYLDSNGCSFGIGEAANALPSWAVKLTGNGYTNGATETRAIFGGTTCSDSWTGGGTDKICTTTAKSDNDTTSDGIGDNSGSNGSVVQFVRAAVTDTKGTIEGLPTAAFDWNTFAYYSTYVAYHDADASGTKDRIYVRQTDGSAAAASYYWEAPAGGTIVGTPRWYTSGSHYVYVALASGSVYQLVDNTTAHTLSTTGASWTTNPFTSATTITTPLSMDASNIYFGGTFSGNKVFGLKQSDGTPVTGSPFPISAAVTSAAPAIWTNGADTMVTLGLNGQITHVDVTNSVMTFSNTSPVGSVSGRIGYGTKTTATLFVGDNMGNMLGITPTDAANAARWSLSIGASTTISPSYYDYTGDTLMFGTAAGKLYSLSPATTSGSSVTLMTGYTSGFAPNSNADAFNNAPLYASGILVAGNAGSATNGGKLYIIDRNSTAASPCTASGPTLLRQYNFGPSVSVSGVGYDSSSNRYMVSTSSNISDGSLYYIDRVTDPTSACN